ncbi:MAG: hypothetical protein ACWGSD_20285, partial [Thermodesulfobacteriota bacterium]
LLGPHFEHPWFPEGNDIIHQWIEWHVHPERPAVNTEMNKKPGKKKRRVRNGVLAPQIQKDFKREISNMRIRADAMTRRSVHWQIGAKVYEPEKILHFVDAIWKRIEGARSPSSGTLSKGLQEVLVEQAAECNGLLKSLGSKIDSMEDSEELAGEMFTSLKALVVGFLGLYFDGSGSDTGAH